MKDAFLRLSMRGAMSIAEAQGDAITTVGDFYIEPWGVRVLI